MRSPTKGPPRGIRAGMGDNMDTSSDDVEIVTCGDQLGDAAEVCTEGETGC